MSENDFLIRYRTMPLVRMQLVIWN